MAQTYPNAALDSIVGIDLSSKPDFHCVHHITLPLPNWRDTSEEGPKLNFPWRAFLKLFRYSSTSASKPRKYCDIGAAENRYQSRQILGKFMQIELNDIKAKQAPCGMGEPVVAGVVVAVIRFFLKKL